MTICLLFISLLYLIHLCPLFNSKEKSINKNKNVRKINKFIKCFFLSPLFYSLQTITIKLYQTKRNIKAHHASTNTHDQHKHIVS